MPNAVAPPADSTARGVAAFALLVAVFVAYGGSLRVPFFFDDDVAIVQNPSIRDLRNLIAILSPPNDGSGVTGRPLVNLSLALNFAVGGTNPRGYHVFNLGLHVGSALALYGIIRRTLLSPRFGRRYFHSAGQLAFTASLLWAVHPLQTESVSCVIQRTELLVGLFLLLTLYGFIRLAGAPGSARWAAATIASCALGMASKELMVVAPLLVLLYDRTFVVTSFNAAWQHRRAFYSGLVATWLILALLLVRTGGHRGPAAGFGLGVPWWSYALKQAEALVTYLKLALWPQPLIIDYGTDLVRDPSRVVPQIIFVLAAVGVTLRFVHRRATLGFILAWFFAILAPSSSVVPLVTQTMAEHRMYLPLASVIILVVLAADHLMRHFRTLAFISVAVASMLLTNARNRTLQDPITLWADTVGKRPANPRAHASLGLALYERGRPHHALPHFHRALQLDPTSSATEQNLGNAYYRLGEFAEASTHFRRAVELDSNSASAHNNLGAALLELGDTSGALAEFDRALALDPALQSARENAARLRAAPAPAR